VKICVAAEEALRKKERQDGTRFPTKIGGKTSLVVPKLFRFVKFSFLVYTFDALLCRNWSFSRSNCETLLITLICLH
jgi:hypothetical protein